MKITQANLNRIMRIDYLPKRKAKLEDFLLSPGWHGGVWQDARKEWLRLSEMGVKTALEARMEELKRQVGV